MYHLLMKYFFTLFLILSALICFSQEENETFKIENSGITSSHTNLDEGNIVITQNSKIRDAIKRHIEINDDKFIGYRVQIYFRSGQKAMAEAQSVKKRFLIRYGNDHGAYIIYDSPNFKVQVGDFRTKAEALHFMSKIQSTFPNSWVVERIKVNYPAEISE